MIKSIILDYDGVIRHPDEKKMAEVLHSKGFELKKFFQLVFDNQYVTKLITGKLDRSTWWIRLQDMHPELKKVNSDFLWDEVFVFPIIDFELLDFVRELKVERRNELKLAILSNADKPSKQRIKEQVEGYPFDVVLTSSDVGIAKPKPAIYHEILKLLDNDPNETLFFDDRKPNVNGARLVGINSFQYQNLAQFKQTLGSFSL